MSFSLSFYPTLLHPYSPPRALGYDFNLSPDTLKYNYLPMFIDAGILEYNDENLLVLSAKGKNLQTTEDGLTDEQLKEELAEEN